MKTFLALAIFFSVVSIAQAETMYIEDQLKLPMRKGQSTSHAIVRMLPSGMKVEVLERNKETGYARIRTPAGTEGWVLSRYLMKTPAARERLKEAEAKLAALEAEKAGFDAKLNALSVEKEKLEHERARLREENSRLTEELDHIRRTSANAVAIAEENKALKGRLAVAEQELQSLRQETNDLKSGVAQQWFMLGGGAVLLGIILGLILPNLRMRRRSRWGRY
jgi:SH3 domain protein